MWNPYWSYRNIRFHVERFGWPGGFQLWLGKLLAQKTRSFAGENVYDRDWDVLVILDACRVDLLEEVADEYPFVRTVDTAGSLGSCTYEWMPATFESAPRSELRETAYVCGNPFSGKYLDADDFAVLDEVWRYAWDDDVGTVPPRPVTDRAVAVGRERSFKRMIVHYMQPHTPFVGSPDSPPLTPANFGGDADDHVLDDWGRIYTGERAPEEVWSDYRDNLRLVLDDVALLVENLDASELVLTSDHGNAAGEYGIYGHPEGIPLAYLREVPWVRTRATDRHTYEPQIDPEPAATEDVDERLKALGYRT